jgi:hypothetical protein
MSFTNDVKRELCGCDVPDNLRDMLRYGMMFGFKGDDPYFLTRDKAAAGYVRRIFPKNSFEVRTTKLSIGESYCVMAKDRLLPVKYGYFENRLIHDNIGGSDTEVGMFLRGLFITSGSMHVQKAGYHFELSVGSREKCEELFRLINEQGMNINISHRGSSYFLYSKNSENISDILTFMGAVQSAMEIMNIKIMKEVRSSINRSVNCETANIDRTVRASAKQLDDIKLVLDTLGDDRLPEELREIAKLRLANPDMSLRDLGKLAEPNISRSGVNHRFERLAKLADEIRTGECSFDKSR